MAVGLRPAVQLALDASCRLVSEGHTVRHESSVGLVKGPFQTTPVAPLGIVQFPWLPQTLIVCVAPAPSGVARPPIDVAARVSMMRHGVMVVIDDGVDVAAPEMAMPPAPRVTATAAPTAAHRDRKNDNDNDPDIVELPCSCAPFSARGSVAVRRKSADDDHGRQSWGPSITG